jgi:hypothetical protein
MNPNTPVELLEILADDDSFQVREDVAGNANSPLQILKQIFESFDNPGQP